MVTAGDGNTASSSRSAVESHIKSFSVRWFVGGGSDYLPTGYFAWSLIDVFIAIYWVRNE